MHHAIKSRLSVDPPAFGTCTNANMAGSGGGVYVLLASHLPPASDIAAAAAARPVEKRDDGVVRPEGRIVRAHVSPKKKRRGGAREST